MDTKIKTFTINYGIQEIQCSHLQNTDRQEYWLVYMPDLIIELTCEKDNNDLKQWLINGKSTGFSEALGAAIQEASNN